MISFGVPLGAHRRARMKGGELITEYLIKNKIPYVFGICGHGNVGMLASSTTSAIASASAFRPSGRARHTTSPRHHSQPPHP